MGRNMRKCDINNIIKNIIRKIPRPNYSELPTLYENLDEMAQRIGQIIAGSEIFDCDSLTVKFDKLNKNIVKELIRRDQHVMVPFFVMLCGFSVRELERLYGVKDVYSLRRSLDEEKLDRFADAIVDNLKYPISLETVLFKFYKNWEEHQKRHYRGREAEKYVVRVLREYGYEAGKIKVKCGGRDREIDCAIPPSPRSFRVAIMVRRGVFRDLVKRAKEYSSEFDELLECFPDVRFVVVYFVSPHERNRIEEIRGKIVGEREGKRPYDLVVLTPEELKTVLIRKLREWGVSRSPPS